MGYATLRAAEQADFVADMRVSGYHFVSLHHVTFSLGPQFAKQDLMRRRWPRVVLLELLSSVHVA